MEKKILIAEDATAQYMLERRVIEKCCPEVSIERVSDGVELIDYLESHDRPDLILLDINMPRKNGLEALREIKTQDNLRPIPVIVISSSCLEEDIETAYSGGAAGYIRKPASLADLKYQMECLTAYWFDCASLPEETVRKKAG